MRRRKFITLLGGAASPFAAMAQEPGRTYHMGCLLPNPPNEYVAFFDGLRRRGFIEGQNLTVEYRAYGQHVDLIPQYAAELVKARVDVIAGSGDEAVRALQQATKTIPIVGMVSDMLWSGLVTSLARPDGNTMGVSMLTVETDGKRLDILIEAVPGLRRMAALIDVNFSIKVAKLDALQKAARARECRVFNLSCSQRRGHRPSYRQRAGIGSHCAEHCFVTTLPCSSAPHYGARCRGTPADDL